jgi:hypothetical protein
MGRWLTVSVVLFFVAAVLVGGPPAAAADSPVGTWVKKAKPGQPTMTLTIEAWAKGKAKLVWTFKGQGMDGMIMSVVSALDGKDAPVLLNGKDSGETMAISLVDKLHSLAVVKMKGKPFGTSKGAYSPDFNTLTVENDFATAVGGNPAGKTTEVWTRK